jgi:hypothetical protein
MQRWDFGNVRLIDGHDRHGGLERDSGVDRHEQLGRSSSE